MVSSMSSTAWQGIHGRSRPHTMPRAHSPGRDVVRPFSVGRKFAPAPTLAFLWSAREPFFRWAKAGTPIPCFSVSQSACIRAHSVKLGAMPGDSGLPAGIRHEVLHTPSHIHKCLHKRTLLSAQEKCITVLSVPVPPLATLRDTCPHPSRGTSPARRRPRNRAREAVAGD